MRMCIAIERGRLSMRGEKCTIAPMSADPRPRSDSSERSDSRAQPDRALRRARGAVAVLFLTNGALFANIVPRYPEIKAALGMTNSTYGLAVAAFPMGAIIAGFAAAMLIRRWGSARMAVAGTIVTACGVFLAGCAPTVPVFVLGLFIGGAADAVTDVAQNAHGLRVQRGYGRSIINSFHALWSIGAVLGGAMSAGAIALSLPRSLHLGLSGALFALVSLVALRFCLPGLDQDSDEEAVADAVEVREPTHLGLRPAIVATIVALVLIAIAGAMVEDAGSSWATLYLSDSLHASSAIAASGYIALVGAQFVGRLMGDRLIDRFGERAVVRGGGLVTTVGMGLALAFPTVAGSVVGFAVAGFGVATLVPTAMHEADELPGLRHGSGLTIVSWLMRLGFLLSPPVVGAVADAWGLRVGLLSIPVAGVVVLVLSGVLPMRRVHDRGVDGRSETKGLPSPHDTESSSSPA